MRQVRSGRARHILRAASAAMACLAVAGFASPSDAGHDAERLLRERCAADWPDDAEKQTACVTDHMEAALRYMAGRRRTESGTPEREVYVSCFDASTGTQGTDWLEAEACVARNLKTGGGLPPDT